MKTLRFILTVSFLTSLIVPQTSTVARCQMSMGVLGVACPMACCKTTPMPAKCQIRTSAVRDVIAPSTTPLHALRQVLLAFARHALVEPSLRTAILRQITFLTASLFRTAAPLGRAPPAEYIQFSA